MRNNRYWEEEEGSPQGRREERDYMTKYRHKIYDYTDDDDDYNDDEESYSDDTYEDDQ
jgi:hypothetical protein